jgi:hypothetical protein
MICVLCLTPTTDAPVQLLCLRAGCTVPLVACAACCKEREGFGKDHLEYVRSLVEVRHMAANHGSRLEARQ